MIIIDYILGAHYVPACLKCFIRMVLFNPHINPGGGYYFILYLLREETGLGRITSPPKVTQQLDSIPLLISYLLQVFSVFWEWQCSNQQDKSPLPQEAYILEPKLSLEEHRTWR